MVLSFQITPFCPELDVPHWKRDSGSGASYEMTRSQRFSQNPWLSYFLYLLSPTEARGSQAYLNLCASTRFPG